MKTLVLNSGSSSIKYQLFDMSDRSVLAAGILEQIGEAESHLRVEVRQADGDFSRHERKIVVAHHRQGLEQIAVVLTESGVLSDTSDLVGIGHRVVHGGESFKEAALVSTEVIEEIRRLSSLAPLHNPANVMGIEVAKSLFPKVPQVVVFDTAFHQTLPKTAYLYAVPFSLYDEHRIRRYGFHGTSHSYVAKEVSRHLGRPLEEINVIVLHLGNGASAAAISRGKSIDTSMGLTPLAGLVMGTRCGDIDPAVVFHVCRVTGKSDDEVEALLNRESGLKGICGVNDMREIYDRAEQGDERAALAIDIYCYRIKKYLGAYFAVLGHVDAIAFTAGIGENAWYVRERSCQGLEYLGVTVDQDKNRQGSGTRNIESTERRIPVLLETTDEKQENANKKLSPIRNSA